MNSQKGGGKQQMGKRGQHKGPLLMSAAVIKMALQMSIAEGKHRRRRGKKKKESRSQVPGALAQIQRVEGRVKQKSWMGNQKRREVHDGSWNHTFSLKQKLEPSSGCELE